MIFCNIIWLSIQDIWVGLGQRSDSWMGAIGNSLGMLAIINFLFDINVIINLQLKDLKQCPQQVKFIVASMLHLLQQQNLNWSLTQKRRHLTKRLEANRYHTANPLWMHWQIENACTFWKKQTTSYLQL